MRASSSIGPFGLTLALLTGCNSSVQVSAKASADASTDVRSEVATEPTAPAADASTPSAPPPANTTPSADSGPPIVTYPGFEVLPDGRSVVSVTMRGNVPVSQQSGQGRVVFALSGVSVPDKVNRLPLLTQHFPTQISAITVEQATGGANLVIELREPSQPSFKVSQLDNTTMLTVVFPKSEQWSSKTGPAAPPAAAADSSAASTASTEAPASPVDDGLPSTPAGDGDEQESEETRRRRQRSKRQPRNYASRYLTLPYDTLAPDVGVSILGLQEDAAVANLNGSIRWGLINELEVEATPVAVRLAPDTAYAAPSIGATGGFTQGTFEIAARLRYFFGIDTAAGGVGSGALTAGIPARVHLGESVQMNLGAFVTAGLDSGAAVGLYERTASPAYVDPGVPLHFVFQLGDITWLGAKTGLSIFDFDAVDETLSIPVGVELGFTQSDDYNPVGDLGIRADLPQLIRPGALLDVFSPSIFGVGVWYRWYYHL